MDFANINSRSHQTAKGHNINENNISSDVAANFKNIDGSISFETAHSKGQKTVQRLAMRTPNNNIGHDQYEEHYSSISSLLNTFQNDTKNGRSPISLRLKPKVKKEDPEKKFKN